MKVICFALPLIFFTLVLMPAGEVLSQDMRELQIQAREAREALLQKAIDEEKAAREESLRSKALISEDRNTLEQAIKQLETMVQNLDADIKALETEDQRLGALESELSSKLAVSDSVVRELVGVVRINAKDIDTLIANSLQTASASTPTDFLLAIAGQSQFPGMADIQRMVSVIWEQISTAGDVRLARDTIIDRSGASTEADILYVGNFTAAYRMDGEAGFLSYSPAGRKLYALSRLPSGRMQRQLHAYMEGRSEEVPMDISRGGALSQLVHQLSLWEQIPKGGLLVWPILALLALGIVIVIERVVFLVRRRMDADNLTQRLEVLAGENDWQGCRQLCDRFIAKPVARVVAAGLACCHMSREDMENALQEAILREVPSMERFLSTLGMLAAIAPLLGLLGTVTGMIDTFHVITSHGTGDPRMMSGGISEALVTTMLGLSVAIPIMLAHTLLGRTVDRHIGRMEEKAVALVNIVHKSRAGDKTPEDFDLGADRQARETQKTRDGYDFSN